MDPALTTPIARWRFSLCSILATGLILLGCSPAEETSTSGSGGATSSKGKTHGPETIPEVANTENWQQVKAVFSTLSTVAGRGASDSNNEWQASFEGSSAISAELSRPHMAMADGANNIYIADKESHGIRMVTPEGRIYTVAGTNVAGNAPDDEMSATEGALSSPNGLWVHPNGTFYILDLGNAKIRRVTPDGRMSTLFTLDALPIGRGLWIAEDESEALVAAESTLIYWSASAGPVKLASGFGSLGMVLKTAKGQILVGDRDGRRVYAVAPDGSKTVVAGDGSNATFVDGARATETAFDEPRALWPYAGGLLVGLHNGCKIIYVDSEGYAHLMLRGSANSHRGDGAEYDPTVASIGEVRSLTVSPAGDIIFVENDVGFVRRVAAVR